MAAVVPASSQEENAMNIKKFMNNSATVVVAAGLSSRMKDFKPMMPLAGDSVIRTLITTLIKAEIGLIVVVTGRNSEQLAEHLADLGVEIVVNPEYATTDMFYSACLGFSAIADRAERTFFLPADVPLFSPYSVTAMKEYMDDNACDILIPSFNMQQGHPILLKNKVLADVLDYQGQDGLRGAIKHCGAKIERIDLPDPGLIMDADNQEEYAQLLAYARSAPMSVPLQAKADVKLGKDVMFFDADFAQLLELTDKCRSLTKACQQAGVSYSNAWKNVKIAEGKLGFVLLQSSRGGAGGGGSKLTRRGKDLLNQYKKFAKSVEKYSQKQFEKYFSN